MDLIACVQCVTPDFRMNWDFMSICTLTVFVFL